MVALLILTKLTPISVWTMMYFYKLMQVSVHLMQVPFGFFYVIYAMILDLRRLMMVFNVNNSGFYEGNA
jgi:hypothetical protein